MYGLIGTFTAHPGKRDALIASLPEGAHAMPGCLSYGVARDPPGPDTVWIAEVWSDTASRKASLQLPAVKDAIARALPLIAGFGTPQTIEPVGGHGLRH